MSKSLFDTKHINFRTSITVLISTAIAIAAIVVYVDRTTSSLTYEMESEAIKEIAKSTVRTLDENLQDSVHLANIIAAQRAVRVALQDNADPEGVAQDRVKAYLNQYKEILSLDIVNAKGEIIAGGDMKGADQRGQNVKDQPQVKEVLSGRDKSLAKSVDQAGDALAFKMAVPVKTNNGNLLGAVLVSVDMAQFNREHIDGIKIRQSGKAFLLDTNGVFIAHGDHSIIGKSVADLPFVRIALQQKNGFLEYDWDGSRKLLAFDSAPTTGWIVCVSVPLQEAMEKAVSQRNGIMGIGVAVCAALVLLLVLVIHKMVVNPILSIERFAAEIAEGEYSTELTGSFQCELAELARSIQYMRSAIKHELGFAQGVLKGIPTPCGIVGPNHKMIWCNQQVCTLLEKDKKPDDYVGMASGEFYLNDPSRETLSDKAIKLKAAQAKQIEWVSPNTGKMLHIFVSTTPFFDMDGKLLGSISFWHDITDLVLKQQTIEAQHDRIAESAKQANAIADRLSTAAEELSAQVEEASRGTDHQKERLSETASAVGQMNASILEVARNASDASHNAEQSMSSARNGASVVHDSIKAIAKVQHDALELRNDMKTLEEQTNAIGQIMGIISDIADQTNLLALNAAIEAARAGDAGRGFAVVADEVRKLAEKTMSSTKEVGTAVSAIQAGTKKNVHSVDTAVGTVKEATKLASQSGKELEAIVGLANKTSDQVRSIATAAEEQSAASEQIAKSAEEINGIATDTAQSMLQSSQAVNDLAQMASELKQIIGNMQA